MATVQNEHTDKRNAVQRLLATSRRVGHDTSGGDYYDEIGMIEPGSARRLIATSTMLVSTSEHSLCQSQ